VCTCTQLAMPVLGLWVTVATRNQGLSMQRQTDTKLEQNRGWVAGIMPMCHWTWWGPVSHDVIIVQLNRFWDMEIGWAWDGLFYLLNYYKPGRFHILRLLLEEHNSLLARRQCSGSRPHFITWWNTEMLQYNYSHHYCHYYFSFHLTGLVQ